jgi:RNA polymerase sigma-70 factor, ECF subfamily
MTKEQIYERCREAVERFFVNKVRRDEDVEDLMHETFCRFFTKLDGGLVVEDPIRYLIGIAKNVVHEYWRAHADVDISELSIADMGCGIITIMTRVENQRRMLDALRKIRLDFQIVLELHYWEGMSYEAISASIGVPSGTVGTWVHRGTKALRKILESTTEPPGPEGADDEGSSPMGPSWPGGRGPPAPHDAVSLGDRMEDAREATSRRSKKAAEGAAAE